MSLWEDDRWTDRPPHAVQCSLCQAVVGVRKSGWDQTSIEWWAESASLCRERHVAGPDRFIGCSALREAVRRSVELGEVSLPPA